MTEGEINGGAPRTPMLTVIAASAAGTACEWYYFFVFGTLTPTIAKNFFAELGCTKLDALAERLQATPAFQATMPEAETLTRELV